MDKAMRKKPQTQTISLQPLAWISLFNKSDIMKNLLLFGALVGIPIVSSAQTGFDFNSAMLLAENYLNSKENQFCYVVYYDLESSEIAEMVMRSLY